MQIAADPIPVPRGSHPVDVAGDRVIIRGLELFCGYDPEIDDAEGDEVMAGMTPERVEAIVLRTQAFMDRGQTPKLVVRHKRDNEETPAESVGDITAVRVEDRNGVAYILGDVEMSRWDFDAFIASNRYPRRSAEIWASGYLSEVALLGRETPRRPLPDTKFERDGERLTFSRPLPPLEFAHPGATNTFVPTTGGSSMDAKDWEARFAKLEKAVAALTKTMNMSDEEDKDKEENAKAENGRGQSPDIESIREAAKQEAAKAYQRELDALREQVERTESERRRERADREIKDMETEGFRFGAYRDAMVERLMAAKDIDSEITMLRDIVSRDPINHTVPALKAARTPAGGPSEKDLDAARERAKARCQREGKHDGADYRRYLDEELASLNG